MMPARLNKPTVGLIPTIPQVLAGHTIEPSVSVPMETAHKFAAVALPEPELDPHGLRSSTYGLRHCPPRALHPLDDRFERIFAHSLRLALPKITAPASLSFFTINASRGGTDPASARDPAVVVILSAVSMLSFTSTGMP